VLEIDINIRRLAALFRDETLEQHAGTRGVDFGNPERKTHRRIRRRAAPLAQNADAASKNHDVVHGEEIGFVLQIGDQRQLMRDALAHVVRRALRVAAAQASLGFVAQPGGRRMAVGDDFLGIFVTQLVERKSALRCDIQCFGQQPRRIKPRQAQTATQMALAIGEKRIAGIEYRGF